jgi:hypothetical protein
MCTIPFLVITIYIQSRIIANWQNWQCKFPDLQIKQDIPNFCGPESRSTPRSQQLSWALLLTMPLCPASNKDRVYVAIYGRQDPNMFHWAIIVGPKNEVKGVKGCRYHVKQRSDPARPGGSSIWVYESLDITLVQNNAMLLGRILIAKVTDDAQLRSTLAAVPIVQDDPSWGCRIWVRDAIAALEADGKSLGTRITDWETVEQAAVRYIWQKRQQKRYDGLGSWEAGTIPTFDLLAHQEIVP